MLQLQLALRVAMLLLCFCCCCCCRVVVLHLPLRCTGDWQLADIERTMANGQGTAESAFVFKWSMSREASPWSMFLPLCQWAPSIVQLSGCCVLCFWHPFDISGISVCFNFVPNYCHGWISLSHYVFQSVLMPQTVLKVGEVNQIISQGRIWFSYIFSIHKSLWVSNPKVRLMPQTVLEVGEVNQIINQGRFWFSYIFSIHLYC